jgi:hypothetical protein
MGINRFSPQLATDNTVFDSINTDISLIYPSFRFSNSIIFTVLFIQNITINASYNNTRAFSPRLTTRHDYRHDRAALMAADIAGTGTAGAAVRSRLILALSPLLDNASTVLALVLVKSGAGPAVCCCCRSARLALNCCNNTAAEVPAPWDKDKTLLVSLTSLSSAGVDTETAGVNGMTHGVSGACAN